jgi:hypothetical protein
MQSLHKTLPPPPPPRPLAAMKTPVITPNSTQGLTSTEGLLLNAMGRSPVNESMRVPFNSTAKPSPMLITRERRGSSNATANRHSNQGLPLLRSGIQKKLSTGAL